MSDSPTVGDLIKARKITDEYLRTLVDAYLNVREPAPVVLGTGDVIDIAAAVVAHPQAREALADPTAIDAVQRTVARTAILPARPKKR